MILIISEKNDPTTDDILRWFITKNVKFIRINDSDFVEVVYFKLTQQTVEFTLKIGDRLIENQDISAYYYRRGMFNLMLKYNYFNKINNENLNFSLKKEIEIVQEFIHSYFENEVYSLGRQKLSSVNKLKILHEAIKVGLSIPDTHIISNKQELNIKLNKEKSYITKNIYEVSDFTDNEFKISVHNSTSRVDIDDYLKHSSDDFLPTLFQTEIKKDFEIRAFYVDGEIYSSAILSQNNPKTEIDFRYYDDAHPNRVLPFQLPEIVEEKITLLMKNINLNIGCIDLIVSDNSYYFLEVNPVGQYGMVSDPCNYHLSQIMAEKLIKNGRNI